MDKGAFGPGSIGIGQIWKAIRDLHLGDVGNTYRLQAIEGGPA